VSKKKDAKSFAKTFAFCSTQREGNSNEETFVFWKISKISRDEKAFALC